jgi:hypothetical protein
MHKYIIILLLFPLVSKAQFRDTIFVNRTVNTIIELADGGPIIHLADLSSNATSDITKIKSKVVFFAREGTDQNKRYFKFKAIRPFEEDVIFNIICDSSAVYVIKYSEKLAKAYYKLNLPTFKIPIESEEIEEKTRFKEIKYSPKDYVKFQNLPNNVFKVAKWNQAIFTSIGKAYRKDNILFLQIKIANHSVKNYMPEDIEIIGVDISGTETNLSYRIVNNYFETIPNTSSLTANILLQEKNIDQFDHFLIQVKEQTLARNIDLTLSMNNITLLTK